MTMRGKRTAMGIVTALIALPGLVVVAEAAGFFMRYSHNGSIVSSGIEREYELYVPASYDPARATPLVITLHGAALWGPAQREISHWNDVADRHGFIVVYPSGRRGPGPRVWSLDTSRGISRDVRFVADLIDTLRRSYHIDTMRIYANGLSNGGGMSFVLSCTMPDRIAAVGMVGPALLVPFDWCPDRNPVPVIAFHGTADNAAPYEGGASWVTSMRFPDVRKWMDRWSKRNGCAPLPIDTTIAADVVRRAYSACTNAADIVLYTIVGGGHTWPGGPSIPEWAFGKTATSIDASALMWTFFQAHPLRPAR
jgi:polyhydroxybutyrate depolymerase